MRRPYVSMMVSWIEHSVISLEAAFEGHPMKLSAEGVTGTAEIVVSDQDGVGVILRIANCLMKSDANNCLSLSQLQQSGNVAVYLDGTSPTIDLGLNGGSGLKRNSAHISVTVGNGQHSVPFAILAANDPRRKSMAVCEIGCRTIEQELREIPGIEVYCGSGPLRTSFIDFQTNQTIIAVGGAFIAETLRSTSAGVSGTAEIVVQDSDGVGVILRITNCLMSPSTHNLLSFTQFQRCDDVMVNIHGTSASIEVGRRGWFSRRLHSTDQPSTILPMIVDHGVCKLPFMTMTANDPRRKSMQIHTIGV